jgi:hypothetical protein
MTGAVGEVIAEHGSERAVTHGAPNRERIDIRSRGGPASGLRPLDETDRAVSRRLTSASRHRLFKV